MFNIIEILQNLVFFALHLFQGNSFEKPLSLKEEEMYFERYRKGDEKAKEILITHNLRLVVHIIKKYYATHTDQEDLISIGTIGLIKAVTSFSYEKGTRFATYASKCIENEILMHFRATKKMAQDVYIFDSIDLDKDGNTLTLLDVVSDNGSLLDETITNIDAALAIKLIEEKLSPREREVLKMRYGIGCIPMPQREVAKKLDISRSYVSRIEKKALSTLKEYLK